MNQKGGAMIEAAVVFPIVIFSLMTIIAILMFLFEEAASQAELHLVIRTEAGRQNGTFHGKTGSQNVTVEKGLKGIHSVMNGKSSATFEETRLLPLAFHKPLSGYQHLIDERKYARYIDFFLLEEHNESVFVDKTIE